MSTVTQILNWISSSLLLPVIVLLLAALAGALVSLGGFCATYLLIIQERKKRRDLLTALRSGKLDIVLMVSAGIGAMLPRLTLTMALFQMGLVPQALPLLIYPAALVLSLRAERSGMIFRR